MIMGSGGGKRANAKRKATTKKIFAQKKKDAAKDFAKFAAEVKTVTAAWEKKVVTAMMRLRASGKPASKKYKACRLLDPKNPKDRVEIVMRLKEHIDELKKESLGSPQHISAR